MSTIVLLKLVAGLVILVIGGELLIRGASKIASFLGVSPLVIGLTVVAFGTSAPELVVSLQSSLSGHNEIAVANVVGSNIFNLFFILGACALASPLIVNSQLVRLDVPVMVAAALLLFFFSRDGVISTAEGLFLTLLLISYTAYLIRKSRSESAQVQEEFEEKYAEEKLNRFSLAINIGFVLAGLGLLVLGGDLLVSGAVAVAKSFGVSETVIGLTIVAAGTSLPEVASSIIATVRGERDIAIGNVVGSNIFNVLMIVGLSSVFAPGELTVSEEMLKFDLPVMIAASVASLPIFIAGFCVTRVDGALFLISYLVYVTLLVLSATKSELLPGYQQIVTYGVLPIIGSSLLRTLYVVWKQTRKS